MEAERDGYQGKGAFQALLTKPSLPFWEFYGCFVPCTRKGGVKTRISVFVAYVCSEILLSLKKGHPPICDHMDEPGGHCAK